MMTEISDKQRCVWRPRLQGWKGRDSSVCRLQIRLMKSIISILIAPLQITDTRPIKANHNDLSEKSPPALVDTGPGLFAAILRQRGIIRVALLATAVIAGRVVGVERGARAQPLRQVGICDELAAECDEVGPPLANPLRGGADVETSGGDQRPLEPLAD